MIRNTLFLLLITGATLSYGQEDERNQLEGHYLGFQINELVRQVLSLGTTNTPNNPYFLNYSYVSPTGDGLNIGIAYSLDNFETPNQFNDATTDIRNVSFRIGYEKKKYLGKNFVYGIGFDLTLDSDKNETVSRDAFSSSEVITTSKLGGWGLGPRFMLSYQVSNTIWVGTEANYYFKRLKNTFELDFSDNPSFDDNDTETKIKQFQFASPAILWLSIRL